MSHEIDLKKCKIHTDLVIEELNLNNEIKDINVTSIYLNKKQSIKMIMTTASSGLLR